MRHALALACGLALAIMCRASPIPLRCDDGGSGGEAAAAALAASGAAVDPYQAERAAVSQIASWRSAYGWMSTGNKIGEYVVGTIVQGFMAGLEPGRAERFTRHKLGSDLRLVTKAHGCDIESVVGESKVCGEIKHYGLKAASVHIDAEHIGTQDRFFVMALGHGWPAIIVGLSGPERSNRYFTSSSMGQLRQHLLWPRPRAGERTAGISTTKVLDIAAATIRSSFCLVRRAKTFKDYSRRADCKDIKQYLARLARKPHDDVVEDYTNAKKTRDLVREAYAASQLWELYDAVREHNDYDELKYFATAFRAVKDIAKASLKKVPPPIGPEKKLKWLSALTRVSEEIRRVVLGRMQSVPSATRIRLKLEQLSTILPGR